MYFTDNFIAKKAKYKRHSNISKPYKIVFSINYFEKFQEGKYGPILLKKYWEEATIYTNLN